jgi:8-hydroxy-5-deazaflavin:NADPH oxidoreductase
LNYWFRCTGFKSGARICKKSISAIIGNRRGPKSLADLIRELGPSIKTGTVAEAASADIVIVAVRFEALETALAGLPARNNRIVIDDTNAVEFL